MECCVLVFGIQVACKNSQKEAFRVKKFHVLTLFLIVGLLFSTAASAQNIDFGGRTITFVGSVDKIEQQRNSGLVAQAEELFNCKLEVLTVPATESVELMVTRLISGDSEWDVWAIDNGDTFYPLIASDALLPLNDILGDEYYELPRRYAKPAVDAFSIGDNIYVVGSFEILPNGATTWLVFNKDMIDAEGLPSPYDLYFDGEWNWENFHEMAVAATRDFDGDGEPDQWGIQGLYTWAYLVASNGVNFFVPNEEGRPIYNWNHPAVLEAMAFGRQLASIDKVNTTGGFTEGQTLFAFQATWQLDGLLNADVNWGLMPFPKGPSAEYHSMYTGFIGGLGLPMNSAAPKEIAVLLDFLFAPSSWETYAEDRYEELVNTYCPDIQSARIFTEFLPLYGAQGEILNYPLTADEVWEAYSSAMQGERTPAEAMNAVAQVGQAYVDDMTGWTE